MQKGILGDKIAAYYHSVIEPFWILLMLVMRRLGKTDEGILADYFRSCDVRKLHIGCGPHILAGWLNADLDLRSKTVLHLNATQRFPLKDDLFDYVFSEHMIEHITYHQGHHMLSECFRIMKPNGKIRITTPNLAFLVDLYRGEQSGEKAAYIKWFIENYWGNVPFYKDTFLVNGYFGFFGHRFIYDELILRNSLEMAGFVNITRCIVGESENEALQGIENEARAPAGYLRLESLVLEGTKPAQDVSFKQSDAPGRQQSPRVR